MFLSFVLMHLCKSSYFSNLFLIHAFLTVIEIVFTIIIVVITLAITLVQSVQIVFGHFDVPRQ